MLLKIDHRGQLAKNSQISQKQLDMMGWTFAEIFRKLDPLTDVWAYLFFNLEKHRDNEIWFIVLKHFDDNVVNETAKMLDVVHYFL